MNKCPHGWDIIEEDKLPYKRTWGRIEVCRECAIKSSLQELGHGIILDEESLEKLKKILNKVK